MRRHVTRALALISLTVFLHAALLAVTADSVLPRLPRSYSASVSLSFPLSSYSLAYTESVSANTLQRRGHFDFHHIREIFDFPNSQISRIDERDKTCMKFDLSDSQRRHHFFAPSWSIGNLFELTGMVFPWRCFTNHANIRDVNVDSCTIDSLTVDTSNATVIAYYDSQNDTVITVDAAGELYASFAALLDQTNELTSDEHYIYRFNVSYHVATQQQRELDGRTPVSLRIEGRRYKDSVSNSDSNDGEEFIHIFDWMLVRPVKNNDFFVPANCYYFANNTYLPPLPQPVPSSALLHYAMPTHLPLPALAFHSLLHLRGTTVNATNNVTLWSYSSDVEWIRDRPTSEVTRMVGVDGTSGSTTDSLTLFNYSVSAPSFNVTNGQCTVGRLPRQPQNIMTNTRPYSVYDFFTQVDFPFRRSLILYRYGHPTRVWLDGVPLIRYSAAMWEPQVWNYLIFNSTIYIRPTGWQTHGDTVNATSSHLVLWTNDGWESILVQPFHPCSQHDKHCNNTKTYERHFFNDQWRFYDFIGDSLTQTEVGIIAANCSSVKPAPFPPMPSAYTSTVVVSSSLTGQTYGYSEYVDNDRYHRFDGRYFDDQTVEVYEFNYQNNEHSNNGGQPQPVLSNSSTLFHNRAEDEGAFGYGSRTNSTLAPTHLEMDIRLDCSLLSWHNASWYSEYSQWLEPAYLHYINRYPFSQWTHAAYDTLYGSQVDQWTVLMQSEDNDTNVRFDSATLYFSWPRSIEDPQVPLRFQFTSVLFNASNSNEESVLENTFVDFIQWMPASNAPQSSQSQSQSRAYSQLVSEKNGDSDKVYGADKPEDNGNGGGKNDKGGTFDHTVFRLPVNVTCANETFHQRYHKLVTAVNAPMTFASGSVSANPTIPLLPHSFSALIVTPLYLESGDSTLYAIRWFVKQDDGYERLDFAPLSTRDTVNGTIVSRTTINRDYDDYGTYNVTNVNIDINTSSITHGNTSVSSSFSYCATGDRTPSVLDTLFAGTLPRLVTSGLDSSPRYTGADVINGINVDCWQTMPYSVRHYQLQTTVCFARSGWVSLGRYRDNSNQTTLVSVKDLYLTGAPAQRMSVTYSFAMFDMDHPSATLFDLDRLGCQPSGVDEQHDSAASDGDDDNAILIIALAVVLSLSTIILIALAVARYRYTHADNSSSTESSSQSLRSMTASDDDDHFASLGQPFKLADFDGAAGIHLSSSASGKDKSSVVNDDLRTSLIESTNPRSPLRRLRGIVELGRFFMRS